MCELKLLIKRSDLNAYYVTPSRVCELKCTALRMGFSNLSSHTLTGVWVEMNHVCRTNLMRSHTLTGVWVEIEYSNAMSDLKSKSHPHGCVSWNLWEAFRQLRKIPSHPHGCVSWNQAGHCLYSGSQSHTLTGVWVEILRSSILTFPICHTLTGVWVEIYQFLLGNKVM